MVNPVSHYLPIHVHKKNEDDICTLHPNSISMIDFCEGKIFFPECTLLSCIQIVFLHPGTFILSLPENVLFSLGLKDYINLKTNPGSVHFDCNPIFIFNPELKKWIVSSQGSFITGFE